MCQAVKALVKEQDINEPLLSGVEQRALTDICEFLAAPHAVQELLSAEKTPTLSLVLPMYEDLIQLLTAMLPKLGKIGHAIRTAILKLKEYLAKSRETRVYALAMSTSLVSTLVHKLTVWY